MVGKASFYNFFAKGINNSKFVCINAATKAIFAPIQKKIRCAELVEVRIL